MNFHVDDGSSKTLQVFLNEEFQGGQTLYVTKNEVQSFPNAKIGDGIIH